MSPVVHIRVCLHCIIKMKTQHLNDLCAAAQNAFVNASRRASGPQKEPNDVPGSLRHLCDRTFDDANSAMDMVVKEANEMSFNVVSIAEPTRKTRVALLFVATLNAPKEKGQRPGASVSETSTRRIYCRWRGMIRYHVSDKNWHFVIQHGTHNHDSDDGIKHQPSPRWRKRTQSVKAEVLEIAMDKKLKARDISEHIRK